MLKIKELSIQLQEKSDLANQLLLENEQLERNVNEKENGLQSQAHTLKEAEKKLQTLSTEKEELEKVCTSYLVIHHRWQLSNKILDNFRK